MPRRPRVAPLAVLVLCACAGPAHAQIETLGSALVNGDPARTAVVAGEVIAVRKDRDDGMQGVVKITHVYSGPKSLKGLALFDVTADANFAGNPAVPLLKVGETGLWLMCIGRVGDNWNVIGRYRKDEVANYDRRIEWAEAVGKLSGADVPKRLKLAQELCGHKTPAVAQLGAEVLLGAEPDDARRADVPAFLDELAKNRAVTASALVRADFLLFRRDGKTWLGSDRRKALLERLLEPLTDADAAEVIDHIRGSWHYQSARGTWLSPPEASALLAKIATDPRQSKSVRGAVVNRLVERAAHAGSVFDVLAAVVRRGDDALRLAAAKGLAALARPATPPNVRASYTPAQVDELRELLKDERDVEVAKALATAIDRSK